MAGIVVGLGLFLLGLVFAALGANEPFTWVMFGFGVAMAIVGAVVLVVAVKGNS